MQAQWPGADRLTPEDNTSADATGMSQPRGQIKEPAQANEQLRLGSSTKRRRRRTSLDPTTWLAKGKRVIP